MVFEIPAAKKSVDQNLFKFRMPGKDDTTYKVPLLQFLRPSLIAQLEQVTKFEAVKQLTDEYCPGLFDRFEDSDQLIAFYNAWAEASGIDLGESSGSTD